MLRIEDLHIIDDNHMIFYEGNKHYFIYHSNGGYTMAIEEIGKDGEIETSYKDFVNVSDAIKHIEQEEFDKINNDVNKLLNGGKIK